MNQKTSLIVKYIGGAFVFLVIAAIVLALVQNYHPGKVAVGVMKVPNDMTLTANSETIGGTTAYLAPGEYTIVGKKDGFLQSTKKITITKKSDQKIIVALVAQSAEAKKWAEKNQDAYLALEKAGGTLSDDEGRIFREKYPITNHLPYKNYLFTISYEQPKGGSTEPLTIVITASPLYREAALNQIRNLGFDPVDFNIKFNNYSNPFSS